jgi:ribosomal protein S18 acetylase RimI-like enzyme
MAVSVSQFAVGAAPATVLRDHYDLIVAGMAVDSPGHPVPPYEVVAATMFEGNPGLEEVELWHARRDDQLVGAMRAAYPRRSDFARVAIIDVRVLPAERRRGVATDLVRAVLPSVRDHGREVVAVMHVIPGSAGARAAEALGFRRVYSAMQQRLDLVRAVELAAVGGAPAGYRVEIWYGATPEPHLKSYASVRQAVDDAPTEESNLTAARWSPQAVRAAERALREGGTELWIVAAADESTGEVVGFSEVHVNPAWGGRAEQKQTAVARPHRQRGLGWALKTTMLRRLRAECPALTEIVTSVNPANHAMISLNRKVGFIDGRSSSEYEVSGEQLAARLS